MLVYYVSIKAKVQLKPEIRSLVSDVYCHELSVRQEEFLKCGVGVTHIATGYYS